MAVTDLTGYTWEGNNSINVGEVFDTYTITYTSNSNNYSSITLNWGNLQYGNDTAYSGSWVFEAYKTIVITGGTDVTNATLIAWLEANGTLTPPVVATGSIYIGTSPIQKCYVGNNEVQKIYIGDKLVYEKQAPTGYQVHVYNSTYDINCPIYDGQDSSGTYLGTLIPLESDTYTITSGYIFTSALATFEDDSTLPSTTGNPFPISSDTNLMLISGSND